MAAPVGRPRKEIDFTEVDKLCALHCTAEEIAGFFEITTFTLDQRIKEQQKPDGTYYKNFLEYFAVKSFAMDCSHSRQRDHADVFR
jgi:hypothetical protein